MKQEWQKHEKDLYTNKKSPALITVPEHKFITISGSGNPNHEDFAERVGALMSLAYPIKMRYKAYCKSNPEAAGDLGCDDYRVYPLEGIWTADGDPRNKDNLAYTIMVRQPDFITGAMFEDALAAVRNKKPQPLLSEISFEVIEDGLCVQILHAGPFDDEPVSFARMEAFMKEHELERTGNAHREIYLKDARKTKPEKYQTILRYCVRKAGTE